MKDKKESLEEFLENHPGIGFDEIGNVEAAYVSCNGKWADSLSDAYDHVKNCPWCQTWIAEQKKLKKLTTPEPAEIEKRIKDMDSFSWVPLKK